MDGHQFDDLLRDAWTSRRSVLGLVLAAGGAIVGQEVTEAKRKKPCPPCKKRKKGKCKDTLPDGTACAGGTCQGGACTSPTCTDGRKNGSESDVDCGGTCPRCANGKRCARRSDCASAFCVDTCEACSVNTDCPSDATGTCECRYRVDVTPESPTCVKTLTASGAVGNCNDCPVGTVCIGIGPATVYYCTKRCGDA